MIDYLMKDRKIPDRKAYRRTVSPSSLLKESLPEGHRATHTKIGREAEKRAAVRLRAIYGHRIVITKGPRASGTDGKPDLLIRTDPPILVEVKTCQLFHKKRLWGVAKTFFHSWKRLTIYAQEHLMNRVMLIEYRHKEASIFVWLTGEAVDRLAAEKRQEKPEIDVFHIEFRQALKHGELLSDRGFSLEPIVTSQRKMDTYSTDGDR